MVRRRDVLKAGAGLGLVGLGGKVAHDTYKSMQECVERTDSVTLVKGDAVVYRLNDTAYYLEHEDHGLFDTKSFGTVARHGPIYKEKDVLDVTYEPAHRANTTFSNKENEDWVNAHVDPGDALNDDAVFELRAIGPLHDKLEASYDQEVCILDRGEASEMRERY